MAVACVAAWLSFAGYGLAIVLAAEAATGSFAVAGAASAAFAVGSALLAPLRGRVVDRHGGRALAAFGVAHGVAMAGLVLACAARSSWLLPAAVAGGATIPPVIGVARMVWTRVAGPRLARTGHAVNAGLGDGAGVAAPALVGGLAAAAGTVGALALLLPGAVVAALLLARGLDGAPSRPRQVAPGGPAGTRSPTAASRWLGPLRTSPGLRVLAGADLAFGVALGALDVAAPALAARESAAALGAVPLAGLALTSVAAAVWSGARERGGAGARYVRGSVLVAVARVPAPLVPSLAGLSGVALVAGVGLGLVNVALFELLDDVVETRQAVEALTWLTSLQGLGLAVGAAAAGALAAHPALALAVAAGPAVLGAAVALAGRRRIEAKVVSYAN